MPQRCSIAACQTQSILHSHETGHFGRLNNRHTIGCSRYVTIDSRHDNMARGIGSQQCSCRMCGVGTIKINRYAVLKQQRSALNSRSILMSYGCCVGSNKGFYAHAPRVAIVRNGN